MMLLKLKRPNGSWMMVCSRRSMHAEDSWFAWVNLRAWLAIECNIIVVVVVGCHRMRL